MKRIAKSDVIGRLGGSDDDDDDDNDVLLCSKQRYSFKYTHTHT